MTKCNRKTSSGQYSTLDAFEQIINFAFSERYPIVKGLIEPLLKKGVNFNVTAVVWKPSAFHAYKSIEVEFYHTVWDLPGPPITYRFYWWGTSLLTYLIKLIFLTLQL